MVSQRCAGMCNHLCAVEEGWNAQAVTITHGLSRVSCRDSYFAECEVNRRVTVSVLICEFGGSQVSRNVNKICDDRREADNDVFDPLK